MTYLLTWNGTLLCRDARGHRFVQRPLLARDGPEPVRLDLAWERLRSDFDRLMRARSGEIRLAVPSGPLAGHTLMIDGERRTVGLSRGGQAMRPGDADPADPDDAAAWRSFLPLSQPDLDLLRLLLSNDWVLHSSCRVLQAEEVRLGRGFMLHLGETAFDLRYQLPFDDTRAPFRLALLRDGWRVEQASLYRPLVYYVALRNPVTLRQLWLSLESLAKHAGYRGQIHLLTDCAPAEIAARVPSLDQSRLSVQRLTATDRVGATAARYSIVDWPPAASFQPVLFVDADTVFDRDITPMLAAIAVSNRIGAASEGFSPLATAPSVGAPLFREDGIDPGGAKGFNSGTLGIPNLGEHGHALRLVRRVIGNRSDLLGRDHFSWVDQPVANYVLHQLGCIETGMLDRFVRHGFDGVERDVRGRRGLVHFWPPMNGERKLDAMRTYMDLLRAISSPA